MFYLRPTNDVTKSYLRHALTHIDSDLHPFSRPAKSLYFCMRGLMHSIYFN